MKYKLSVLLAFLLIGTNNGYSQESDSLNKIKYKKDYMFISVSPIIGGVLNIGQTKSIANTLMIGATVGYGKKYNHFLVGSDLGFYHVFLSQWIDASALKLGAYTEYHFNAKKNTTFLVGLKAYLLTWNYAPQSTSFQFFDDPIDGVRRTSVTPAINAYLGGDFLIKNRYHLILGMGYDYKITNRVGRIPEFREGINFLIDFRIPFKK